MLKLRLSLKSAMRARRVLLAPRAGRTVVRRDRVSACARDVLDFPMRGSARRRCNRIGGSLYARRLCGCPCSLRCVFPQRACSTLSPSPTDGDSRHGLRFDARADSRGSGHRRVRRRIHSLVRDDRSATARSRCLLGAGQYSVRVHVDGFRDAEQRVAAGACERRADRVRPAGGGRARGGDGRGTERLPGAGHHDRDQDADAAARRAASR